MFDSTNETVINSHRRPISDLIQQYVAHHPEQGKAPKKQKYFSFYPGSLHKEKGTLAANEIEQAARNPKRCRCWHNFVGDFKAWKQKDDANIS